MAITESEWLRRAHEADLNIKILYTWASAKCFDGDPKSLTDMAAQWSQVRQKARAGRRVGSVTDAEYLETFNSINGETQDSLSRAPQNVVHFSRYEIAYKWAKKPKDHDQLYFVEKSYESNKSLFLEKLDALETIADLTIEKCDCGEM